MPYGSVRYDTGRLVPFHSDAAATGGDIRGLPLPYKMVVTYLRDNNIRAQCAVNFGCS